MRLPQPTMAEVWDQLNVEDKNLILNYLKIRGIEVPPLAVLALWPIEKVIKQMMDTRSGRDGFPTDCSCVLCATHRETAIRIYETLKSAARSTA